MYFFPCWNTVSHHLFTNVILLRWTPKLRIWQFISVGICEPVNPAFLLCLGSRESAHRKEKPFAWHDVWLQAFGLPGEHSPTISVFRAVREIGKKTIIKWPAPDTWQILSHLMWGRWCYHRFSKAVTAVRKTSSFLCLRATFKTRPNPKALLLVTTGQLPENG